MKFKDINAKFTAVVADYLGKGWTINIDTMAGSQGEVAKVDLTDGEGIIRAMVCKGRGRMRCYDSYSIVVGKAKRRVKPNQLGSLTIWDNELDIICEDTYYNVGNDWFVSESEVKTCYDKMTKREKKRYDCSEWLIAKRLRLIDAQREIALKFVRRQPKCSRAKVEDIDIYKANGKYTVKYRKPRSSALVVWTLG